MNWSNRKFPRLRSVSSEDLNRFFGQHVVQSFEDLRIQNREMAGYVTSILVRFTRMDRLYPSLLASNRRLESILDILHELTGEDPPTTSSGVEREREIRKHLGDYSLFMSGIFREFLQKRGSLDFYMMEGERSYRRTATLDRELFRSGATRFEILAEEFERLSSALDYMRRVYFNPRNSGLDLAEGGLGLDDLF